MTYKFFATKRGFSINKEGTPCISFLPDMQNRYTIEFLNKWSSGASVVDVDNIPLAYTQANVEALGLPFS